MYSNKEKRLAHKYKAIYNLDFQHLYFVSRHPISMQQHSQYYCYEREREEPVVLDIRTGQRINLLNGKPMRLCYTGRTPDKGYIFDSLDNVLLYKDNGEQIWLDGRHKRLSTKQSDFIWTQNLMIHDGRGNKLYSSTGKLLAEGFMLSISLAEQLRDLADRDRSLYESYQSKTVAIEAETHGYTGRFLLNQNGFMVAVDHVPPLRVNITYPKRVVADIILDSDFFDINGVLYIKS